MMSGHLSVPPSAPLPGGIKTLFRLRTDAFFVGQTPLMYYENAGYNYTIPSCLKSGYYLVRHEIIALHSAWAKGGAQFYPSCHQLKLSSEGTVVPTDLVSIPGVYDADAPNIHFQVWSRKSHYYPPALKKGSFLTLNSGNV